MANNKGAGKGAAAGNTAAGRPIIVQLVPGAKVAFRANTARAAYYARFAQYNGQPFAALAASIAASPPSQPKKGKLVNITEPLQGWVSWFVRHGYITLQS